MIKNTPSIIVSVSFLLLLSCSGMEKRKHPKKQIILAEEDILSSLDEVDTTLDKYQLKKKTGPHHASHRRQIKEVEPGKENLNPFLVKYRILSILDKIDENNDHILSNGYRLNETEDLVKYANLNRQRKKELKSKEENCNPLTITALIMVNKFMLNELIKHLPLDNKHVITHQTLLETLESLKK